MIDIKILGLDASLSCTGRCILEKNNVISYGKIQTKKSDFDNDLQRLKHITDEIEKIAIQNKIKIAALEDSIPVKSSRSVMQLNILKGELIRALQMNQIDIDLIFPSSVKKLVTGNGRATKEDVAKYIQENYIDIGEYSDKQGKNKTSDIYDAISIAIAHNNKMLKE